MTIREIIQEALEKIHQEHGVMITEINADYIDLGIIDDAHEVALKNIKFTGTAND